MRICLRGTRTPFANSGTTLFLSLMRTLWSRRFVVRAFAIKDDRILVTLDADFANVSRYPPANSPGVLRLRIHPATEGAIDALLRSTIPRLAGISLKGKLVVADLKRIRIRG